MKRILFFIALLASTCMHAQLSVNILLPPSGVADKQQLWNIIATNTEASPLSVQAQITFSEINTGQPVFVASAPPMMLAPGTTQVTPGSIGTVLYNIVNPDYRIDPGPNGLLPVGTFMVCYNFVITKYDKVVRECQQINIPPLGPLLLTQPADRSESDNLQPLFSWLPPSPVNTIGNLRYDLRLVEVIANQSPVDAIRDNLAVFTTPNIDATNYPYTGSLSQLQPGKQYAWQVIAMNNLTPVTKSEVWTFSIKPGAVAGVLPKADPVFFKLKKEGATDGYAVFWGRLRFDYLNETADNTWNISFEDISDSKHTAFTIPMDSTLLKRGQNLVNYDAASDRRFIDGHQYVVRVINSRNEVWLLRFEYRKPR